jgi:hypothetical protein
LTTNSSSRHTRFALAIYLTNSHAPRAPRRPRPNPAPPSSSARSPVSIGEDSISHESVTGQKTRADDPSSLLHLSNSTIKKTIKKNHHRQSRPTHQLTAAIVSGEPCTISGRHHRGKCRRSTPNHAFAMTSRRRPVVSEGCE